MKIHKMTFENYRCFLEGEIVFSTTEKKNMVVLVGPNGGGKTETLFAFWWALYGYDFSKLTNKENTPYALNSGLYRELEESSAGTSKECSVIVEFEEEGTTYVVKRWCVFRKTDKQIREESFREFSYFNDKGELSLPIRDSDEIDKRLNRIIPRTILYGIVFDGERMQKLNTPDENSINAIKGVISDITNVELLVRCKENFSSIKRKLNKELNQLSRKIGNKTLAQIIAEEETKEGMKDNLEAELKGFKDELENVNLRLQTISDELVKNKEVQDIENKRRIERETLKDKEKTLDTYYKNFSALLKDGYFIATTMLLSDVDTIIKKYDVPQDLTVPAVRSILKRPQCICGRDIDSNAVKALNELIELLPPDNINSTLAEYVRQIRQRIIDVKSQVKQMYELINSCEEEIKTCKENIASYSARITSMDDSGKSASEAIRLEKENQKLTLRKGYLETAIPEHEDHIEELKHEIQDLRDEREASVGGAEQSNKLSKQISYIEKCVTALDRIEEINKDSALDDVNERLRIAYELLSEDSERGRKIRIIQHNKEKRYQMAVYMEEDYNKLIDRWKHSGEYQKKLDYGISETAIEEEAILRCIDSNSTGQSKINTFSFVKAILDYSNSVKGDDGIAIKKEYPLLIDSPFGDISAGNLSRSSKELHGFAKQVILMIDEDKYKMLRSAFDPYTACRYSFSKADNANYSTIKED